MEDNQKREAGEQQEQEQACGKTVFLHREALVRVHVRVRFRGNCSNRRYRNGRRCSNGIYLCRCAHRSLAWSTMIKKQSCKHDVGSSAQREPKRKRCVAGRCGCVQRTSMRIPREPGAGAVPIIHSRSEAILSDRAADEESSRDRAPEAKADTA